MDDGPPGIALVKYHSWYLWVCPDRSAHRPMGATGKGSLRTAIRWGSESGTPRRGADLKSTKNIYIRQIPIRIGLDIARSDTNDPTRAESIQIPATGMP